MAARTLAALTEERARIVDRLNTVEPEPISKPKKSRLRLAGEACGRAPTCDKPPGHRGSCKGSNNGSRRKPDAALEVATCRVCGCTDADCRACIRKTGAPCYWVEGDLCSACVPAPEPSGFASRLVEGEGLMILIVEAQGSERVRRALELVKELL